MSYADDFMSTYGGAFQSAGAKYNLDPSLIGAQAALESRWGQSGLTSNANNLFGIKGIGDAGSYTTYTNEFSGGRMVSVSQTFAAYSSPGASVDAYGRLLSTSPRYAGVVGQTGAAAATAIGNSGYATDPNYGSKVKSVMDKIDKTGTLSKATGIISDKAKSYANSALHTIAMSNPYTAAALMGADMLGINPLAGESCGLFCQIKQWIASWVGPFFTRVALGLVALIFILMAFYLLGRTVPEVKAAAKALA